VRLLLVGPHQARQLHVALEHLTLSPRRTYLSAVPKHPAVECGSCKAKRVPPRPSWRRRKAASPKTAATSRVPVLAVWRLALLLLGLLLVMGNRPTWISRASVASPRRFHGWLARTGDPRPAHDEGFVNRVR